MEIFFKFAIFFAGTMMGSFFYTLAVRFSDGSFERSVSSALFSTSKCPSCRERIPVICLVPLLGYVFCMGKCKKCKAVISPLYPISEVIYGILSMAIAAKYGITAYSILIYLIIGISLCISVIDFRILSIPNSLVIIIFLLSIYPVIIDNSIKNHFFGLLLTFGFFLVIILVFPGSFGGGDIKMFAVIGFLLGFELSIVALEFSLISGSIIGIIYAFKTKKTLKIKIPFSPFLTTGLIIAILYGNDILLTYYRIVN